LEKINVDWAINSIKCSVLSTVGWKDSRKVLLDAIISDDDDRNDNEWQHDLRLSTQSPSTADDDPPFSYAEIYSATKTIRNRKAPGIDNIDPEIAKKVVITARNCVTNIFNGCLKCGVFPRRWKQGVIRVLLQGT